jgi:hypothetical protein
MGRPIMVYAGLEICWSSPVNHYVGSRGDKQNFNLTQNFQDLAEVEGHDDYH